MRKGFNEEKGTDIAELAEEIVNFDELEMDNDIRVWL